MQAYFKTGRQRDTFSILEDVSVIQQVLLVLHVLFVKKKTGIKTTLKFDDLKTICASKRRRNLTQALIMHQTKFEMHFKDDFKLNESANLSANYLCQVSPTKAVFVDALL